MAEEHISLSDESKEKYGEAVSEIRKLLEENDSSKKKKKGRKAKRAGKIKSDFSEFVDGLSELKIKNINQLLNFSLSEEPKPGKEKKLKKKKKSEGESPFNNLEKIFDEETMKKLKELSMKIRRIFVAEAFKKASENLDNYNSTVCDIRRLQEDISMSSSLEVGKMSNSSQETSTHQKIQSLCAKGPIKDLFHNFMVFYSTGDFFQAVEIMLTDAYKVSLQAEGGFQGFINKIMQGIVDETMKQLDPNLKSISKVIQRDIEEICQGKEVRVKMLPSSITTTTDTTTTSTTLTTATASTTNTSTASATSTVTTPTALAYSNSDKNPKSKGAGKDSDAELGGEGMLMATIGFNSSRNKSAATSTTTSTQTNTTTDENTETPKQNDNAFN